MIVKSLRIQNLRVLRDVEFEFTKGMNVIVGANGSGKSSVLKALRVSLSRSIPKLSVQDEASAGTISFDPEDLTHGLEEEEEKEGITVDVDLKLNEAPVQLNTKYFSTEGSSEDRWDHEIKPDPDVLLTSGEDLGSAPLSLHCSTRRSIPGFSQSRERNFDDDRQLSYPGALALQGIYVDEMFKWIQAENRRSGDRSSRIMDALNTAISTFLERYKDLHIHVRDNEKPEEGNNLDVRVKREGHEISLHRLSDGERGTLAIVLDLARRLAQANPDLDDPIREASAVVLIDELDLHLHPSWQRKIAKRLTETFQKCQFICTTHSPQIIGELQPEEVFILNNGVETPRQSYGMDSNWVLKVLMDTDERSEGPGEDISELLQLAQSGDLDDASKKLEDLKSDLHGFTKELSRAQAIIERKKLLSDATDSEE